MDGLRNGAQRLICHFHVCDRKDHWGWKVHLEKWMGEKSILVPCSLTYFLNHMDFTGKKDILFFPMAQIRTADYKLHMFTPQIYWQHHNTFEGLQKEVNHLLQLYNVVWGNKITFSKMVTPSNAIHTYTQTCKCKKCKWKTKCNFKELFFLF